MNSAAHHLVVAEKSGQESAMLASLEKIKSQCMSTANVLALKSNQLTDLQEAFIHNLTLLEEGSRQTGKILKNNTVLKQRVQSMKKLLETTEKQLMSAQSQLAKQQKSELELRKAIEEKEKRFMDQENALHTKYKNLIEIIRQSKVEENAMLRATIAELKDIFSKEKKKFAIELEKLMTDIEKRAEEDTVKANQRCQELELKVKSCENSVNQEKEVTLELVRNLLEKEDQLSSLRSSLSKSQNKTEELLQRIEQVESLRSDQDSQIRQLTSEKEKLTELLQSTKEKLRDCEEKNRRLILDANHFTVFKQETLKQLECERQASKTVTGLYQQAEEAKRSAQVRIATLEQEATQLRIKLEQTRSNSTPRCEYDSLREKMTSLQSDNQVLRCENDELKRRLDTVHKQMAELSNATCHQNSSAKSSQGLQEASKIIQTLVEDREMLTRLSNRLHAKVRAFNHANQHENKCDPSKQSQAKSRKVLKVCVLKNSEQSDEQSQDANYRGRLVKASNGSVPVGNESMSTIFKLLDENGSNISDSNESSVKSIIIVKNNKERSQSSNK